MMSLNVIIRIIPFFLLGIIVLNFSMLTAWADFKHSEWPFSKNVLLPKMKKVYPKANIKKEIIGEIIGFTKEEKSDAVNLVCNLTGDNSRDVVSFGTEAGLFQELGISTVVCGPGSIEQAHTIDEYVSFDQLKLCLKMLIDLKVQMTN